MSKKVLVAKIISAFGIKGEVKIITFLEDPFKIEKYPLLNEKGEKLKIKISNKNKAAVGSNSFGDAVLIIKIEGINDRNQSEALRGSEIFVEREDFDQLAENEFYYVDLIGLEVIDMDSKKIGKVVNVFEHGAGGVIEIEFLEKKSIENFSFKNEIFPEVNLKKGFIRIDLPEIVEPEISSKK
jgi:16S rRNA processing protein RimM